MAKNYCTWCITLKSATLTSGLVSLVSTVLKKKKLKKVNGVHGCIADFFNVAGDGVGDVALL